MTKDFVFTQEGFESLLDWLNADRDAAGQRYEIIRTGLIKIFVSKGFSDAEDLTDQVINRVITRLPDIKTEYVGDPASYFHGVGRNLIRETYQRKEIASGRIPENLEQGAEASDVYDALIKCLELLPPDKLEIVLDYYSCDKRSKIDHHERMAKALGVTPGNLRVRVHRIRDKLEICATERLRTLH